MKLLHHIAVAAAYTLTAAAIAIGLPAVFPALEPLAAIVIGGIVLVASAVLHEIFLRQEGEGRLRGRLTQMEHENRHLREAVENNAIELDALRNSVQTVYSRNVSSAKDHQHDVESVVAEVKVLQDLITQMSSSTAQAKLPAAAGRGGSVASPSAPTPAEEDNAVEPVPASQISVIARDGERVDDDALPVAAGDPATPRTDAEILNVLRDGLESNRVDLLLQPIVRLPQRKRCYYEAYTRIRDGAGGTMSPTEYIGIAEREGMIAAIDNFLLFRCVQLVRRTRARNRNVGFFCNMSAHSLMDRHFLSNFIEFMSDNSALAPDLIFEFPHATIANRDEELEAHLRHLATMGFRFSVDQVPNFNIDYGELAALHFKYVKMSAETLLQEIRNPSAPIAVEDIKRLIDRNGMDLVVEKIESEQDLLELLDLRIDFGEGYLFGEPRVSRQE